MLKFWKHLLLVLLLGCCCGSFAAPWFARGDKFKIVTIIITGNFRSPRLMAELIQAESRQPYILVPNENSKTSSCFFIPPRGLSKQIPEEKLGSFISFSNCRRVVILGDTRYVPAKYESLIDKKLPVIRITGNDWNRIAEELTDLLNLSNLKKDFPSLCQKAGYTYTPTVVPEKQKQVNGKNSVPSASAAPKEAAK